MAKDPAFLFYPGDYLRDTQCLSEKAQVAYDRIMCEHMRNICEDMNNITVSKDKTNFFIKRLSEDEKSELMQVLTKKANGFQIYWVAESISKRKSYSESRSKNRSNKNKEDMLTYEHHMEIENEIENKDKKKGMGKGKGFNTMPKPEDVNGLPENKIQSAIEQMKITQQTDITKEEVLGMWDVFKPQKLTGNKFYADEDAVQDYFLNWIKKQDFKSKQINNMNNINSFV